MTVGTEELEDQNRSLIQAMQNQQNLSTFLSLVESARMVGTFDAVGPYTVFAPSNEAFEQLPEGNLEMMTSRLNQEELKTLVGQHMVSRRLVQSEIERGARVDMLGGENLHIRLENGAIMIGDATVVTQSIPAKNGVIHIIDRLIVPQSIQPIQ